MIIGGKRACGKSTELIKISYTNNIPIIVLNKMRAEELEYLAKKSGIKIPKPIICKYYQNDMRGKNINEVLIDDVDDILSELLFPAKIVAMSTSDAFMPLYKIDKTQEDNDKNIWKKDNLELEFK